jgi:tellurite resistance protein TerC
MLWLWILFNLFVLGMLALDLGVFHRKAHTVSLKEASIWSVVWISLHSSLTSVFSFTGMW